MGAHASGGQKSSLLPTALGLSSTYSKGWNRQRPQGRDGLCSGKTLATDTQALLERAAPPPPTQTTDLSVQLVCSGLRKLPNFLGSKTSDYPGVGVGTRAGAPRVSQHLSEGHHSVIPVCLGARLSREPALLFYILSHKATCVPHCAQLPLL